jgi:putative FmdB family regulatory protein
MPLYEYRCKKCGAQFEALVANSDSRPACKACGSRSLEKLLSAFSAKVGGGSTLPCEGGACNTGSCPTGSCPFS